MGLNVGETVGALVGADVGGGVGTPTLYVGERVGGRRLVASSASSSSYP